MNKQTEIAEALGKYDCSHFALVKFNQWAGKPISDISHYLKLDIPEATTINMLADLEYIEESKRIELISLHEGRVHLDDTSELKVYTDIFGTQDVMDYCKAKQCAVFDINGQPILAIAAIKTLSELSTLQSDNLEDNALLLALHSRGISFSTLSIITTTLPHIKRALERAEYGTLDAQYQFDENNEALHSLFAEQVQEKEVSYFQFVLDPRHHELVRWSVFQHEKAYTVQPQPNNVKDVALALHTLKMWYKSNEKPTTYLTIHNYINSSLPSKLGIKLHITPIAEQKEIVVIELIKPLTDSIEQHISGYSYKKSLSKLYSLVTNAVDSGESCIICIPKNNDMRLISTEIHNSLVEKAHRENLSLIINTDSYLYHGEKFHQVNLSQVEPDELNALFPQAISVGILSDSSTYVKATELLEAFHTIIAVANTTKSQLPQKLKAYATTF
ncbi:hypothetical protein QTV44_002619 [Vibrio vulnificus]|nr:hypothetical protein [Vibrio vulnificus]